MLKVDDIHQYYGGSHILRGLSFEARLGEVTVVLGRNGVGKTTLLKSLMGVVPVKTGRIGLDGHDITHAPSYERERRGIGYVFQDATLMPWRTVRLQHSPGSGSASRPGARPGVGRSRRCVPSAPDLCCCLDHQTQLAALVFDCDVVAVHGAAEAALR